MYPFIVLLPLFVAFSVGLFGRSFGARTSGILTTSAVGLAAFFSWIAFFIILFGEGVQTTVVLFEWIVSGDFYAPWALRIDTLTVVMLVVVNTVSFLVHLYSIGYMHKDPNQPRFFAYLSLFTFSMLVLVTADNLVQMFFGWEGVGLASYLLIGFWYHKDSANKAAMKAFIVNRVGDFGFALGIFGVFWLFGTVQFSEIFAQAPGFVQGDEIVLNFLGYALNQEQALTVMCLLLFMGAMGKSAQFLLHTWLPDAMEGPTPVSALIHAATMVTAGVFMVARLSPLFELSQTALLAVTLVGATTAFFAATVGLVQNDITRVVAYSTCSQLGYMFVALGVGAYSVAIFHLFTHAFFKALLFLGAGSVIHAVDDEQDMRRMGGLRRTIPYTYTAMLIGTLALTGFPLTAGFFSKDAIIEASFVGHTLAAQFAFHLLVVAALMTSFYSWRLVFMTFHGKSRMPADVMAHAHESPPVMMIPLVVLSVGAVFAGLLFSGNFIGKGYEAFWQSALYTSKDNHILHDLHEVPLWVKVSPFVMMVLGFVLAYLMYISRPELPKALANQHEGLYKFLLNKWYVDELYDFLFVRPSHWIGARLWRVGDGKIIDGWGPDGVSSRVLSLSAFVRKLQTGYVYHYALAMLIGLALLATWSMFHGEGSF